MSCAPVSKPSPAFSKMATLVNRTAQAFRRREGPLLLFTATVFGVKVVAWAWTGPLWFDEFFTYFLSKISPVSEMLKALPADSQPPLQYLIARLFLHLPGPLEVVLRLPDLIAYVAAGLLVYRIVRRHGEAAQAMFAAVLFWGGVLEQTQAITARPYALLMGFTALAFASWQVASERQWGRFWPLCGVSLGLSGAILSHHFGVIDTGLFLAVGEALRAIQRRRIDCPMLMAIGAGLLPLAITLPLARQSHVLLGNPLLNDPHFWNKPNLGMLAYYIVTAPPALLAILLLLAVISPAYHRPGRPEEAAISVPAHEWGAAAALLLMMPVVLAVAIAGTGYFQPKYAITTTIGVAVLAGWGLPRVVPFRPRGFRLLAAAAVIFVLATEIWTVTMHFAHPTAGNSPAQAAISPLLKDAPPGQLIVVANAYEYAPEWWYANAAIRSRLIYLFDLPYAERQRDFLPELSLAIDRKYAPLPIAGYATFLANHPRFLLFCSGRPQLIWISTRLENEGWHLTPIATSKINPLYPDTLYQVEEPQ